MELLKKAFLVASESDECHARLAALRMAGSFQTLKQPFSYLLTLPDFSDGGLFR